MKTKEQIELAQKTIELLQDYIELAKTYKKLKRIESKEIVEEQITTITKVVDNHTQQL